ARGLLQLVLSPSREHGGVALLHQRQRNRLADAGAGTGDNSDLLQRSHQGSSSRLNSLVELQTLAMTPTGFALRLQRMVLHAGRGIPACARRSAADQRSRRSWKYGCPGSIRKLSSASQTSRRAIRRSMGRPTLRFERMVESTETSPTLSAS